MRVQASLRTLALIALTSLAHAPSSHGQFASAIVTKPQTQMIIHATDGATIHFQTVIVSNSDDLRRGLMHVKHLPTNLSMLFLYDPPKIASMWMKNTDIPLDMWWIGTDMTIRHIAHNTTPQSLDSITFHEKVRAVIEVNAGLSRLLGITEGARIELPER